MEPLYYNNRSNNFDIIRLVSANLVIITYSSALMGIKEEDVLSRLSWFLIEKKELKYKILIQ